MLPAIHNRIIELAEEIGGILENEFPAQPNPSTPLDHHRIPRKYADQITDHITQVVANILQSWLNAGSEREVTEQELFDPIRRHVLSLTPEAQKP